MHADSGCAIGMSAAESEERACTCCLHATFAGSAAAALLVTLHVLLHVDSCCLYAGPAPAVDGNPHGTLGGASFDSSAKKAFQVW